MHSRGLKVTTLAAIGLLTGGTCGGALLANYTVAGMDPAYVAQPEVAYTPPRQSAAEWAAEETFKAVERDQAKADFADPWKPEPRD